MEIHTNYITIIHSKSIRNCSKGIKFFYSNKEPILLCTLIPQHYSLTLFISA